MSRQRKMMSQYSSLMLEGFIVVTEIFVSRQKITIKEESVALQSFLCCNRGQRQQGALCRNRTFSCRDMTFPCRYREMCTMRKLGRGRIQSW